MADTTQDAITRLGARIDALIEELQALRDQVRAIEEAAASDEAPPGPGVPGGARILPITGAATPKPRGDKRRWRQRVPSTFTSLL